MSTQWQLPGLTTTELIDLARTAIDALAAHDYARLDNVTRLDLLDEFEHLTNAVPGIGHELINQLGSQGAAAELQISNLAVLLSQRLHITETAARRRITVAAALGPGTALGGQPLPGPHAPTGQAQRDGDINPEHADTILKFFTDLPADVAAEEMEKAEAQLVALARQSHPDDVKAAARQILGYLDPDGTLDEEKDAQGKTFLRIRPQGRDKLTRGSFCIDAETYSYLEPFLAKFARRGMCNPADEHPLFDEVHLGKFPKRNPAEPNAAEAEGSGMDSDVGSGLGSDESSCGGPANRPGPEPDHDQAAQDLFDFFRESAAEPQPAPEREPSSPPDPKPDPDPLPSPELAAAASRDARDKGQRQHDALKFLLRSAMGCPDLGQHRGLPVTAIITMTLKELEAATGYAITGGGSMIPMRQAIRMASHAYHYLLVYDDDGRALYLGRGKRLASADQRLVLYAGDRGCTFPGCAMPGYYCQAHHTDEWAQNGLTNVDLLTFACLQHHALVGSGENDWATTVCGVDSPLPGRTMWHPPASIDPLRRGRINHHHHPDEFLLPPAELPGPPGYIPRPPPPEPFTRFDPPRRE